MAMVVVLHSSFYSSPFLLLLLILFLSSDLINHVTASGKGLHGVQPLSRIAVHKVSLALDFSAYVKASPLLLGLQGEDAEWVGVEFRYPNASQDDWIGVFSPANFNSSTCPPENADSKDKSPYICSAPIKPNPVAVSNAISFANPKAPVYPRLA